MWDHHRGDNAPQSSDMIHVREDEPRLDSKCDLTSPQYASLRVEPTKLHLPGPSLYSKPNFLMRPSDILVSLYIISSFSLHTSLILDIYQALRPIGFLPRTAYPTYSSPSLLTPERRTLSTMLSDGLEGRCGDPKNGTHI